MMTDTLVIRFLDIRAGGTCNMFDTYAVQAEADRQGSSSWSFSSRSISWNTPSLYSPETADSGHILHSIAPSSLVQFMLRNEGYICVLELICDYRNTREQNK